MKLLTSEEFLRLGCVRQGVIASLTVIHFPGLACSFFGVLFIFRQLLTTQGNSELTQSILDAGCGCS